MADRFFIAPFDKESGLTNNVKPWLIPDQAFSTLENAYVFRGRVRKRFGSTWLGDGVSQTSSRLRVSLGLTNGSGNLSVSIPAGVTPAVGQMFSVGTQIFTVYQLGTPAAMYISGTATLATFNTTTGAVVITGAAATTPLYFYPSLPVVGFVDQETSSINNEAIVAFDTSWAYEYGATGWERLATETTPGAATWLGTDSQFFWGTNWTGTQPYDRVLFVTNFNPSETHYMRTLQSSTWTDFRPLVDASNYMNTARILVPYKNRLLAFNTYEGTTIPGQNYDNRVRWSQIGSPLAADAWRSDLRGKGGGLDAPTSEAIITVEFVKDTCIVFFERSTYELKFTQNEVQPFAWQKINTELGAESTFSIVPFDRVALGIGNSGIHACNGSNVERIDNKIPDEVFKIHSVDQGIFRVVGIRDYNTEMVYWTFPDETTTAAQPYPNRVLLYNYANGTWAFIDDSITFLGYYQSPTGVTWDSNIITWDDEVSWNSATLAAETRKVIAGNQEGFTFLIDANHPRNAPSLQITDLLVTDNYLTVGAANHNLRAGDYILISGITGTGNLSLLNYVVYIVVTIGSPNEFTAAYLGDDVIAGTYSGAGLIQKVSNINIWTKEYNFYAQQGVNAYVSKVDFMVDSTATGQIQVGYYVSTGIAPLLQNSNSTGTGSLLGTGNLDTFPYPLIPSEANSSRLWHPVYLQADGECIQLQLTMSDEQMRMITTSVTDGITSYSGPAFEDFQLGAMCITAQPSSSRFQ